MPFDAYVSILAMPVGVMICFGPALLIWLGAELKAPKEGQQEKK